MGTPGTNAFGSGYLPFAVDVYLDTYDGPGWVKRTLRGSCGWLRVSRAAMSTPISEWTDTLLAAVTDDGRLLSRMASASLLEMRSSMPAEATDDLPEQLDGISEMLFWDFLGGCDLRHLQMLEEHEDGTARTLSIEQDRGEKVLAECDDLIASLKREARSPSTHPARLAGIRGTIATFQEKQIEAAHWLVRHLGSIRERAATFETDVLEALENCGEVEELYSVRWTARHASDKNYARTTFRMRMPGPWGISPPEPYVDFRGKSWGAGAGAAWAAKWAYETWRDGGDERRRNELVVNHMSALSFEIEKAKLPEDGRSVTEGPKAQHPKISVVSQEFADNKKNVKSLKTRLRRLAEQLPEASAKRQGGAANSSAAHLMLVEHPTVEGLTSLLNDMLDSDTYDWQLAKQLRRAIRELRRRSTSRSTKRGAHAAEDSE